MKRGKDLKREEVQRLLAHELLKLEIGEQLPTIRDWAKTHRSSVGTVQAVITEFEQAEAVEIERRGWMGTYLRGRSLSRLWNVAQGGDPMVIALPLPSTRICQGLATAIKTLLQENSIEVYLIFLRGSRRRLETLRRQRCHGVVASVFAAQDMCGSTEMCILELPPQTFIKEHRVFFRGTSLVQGTDHTRVAIDRDSADLQRLTELEFQNTDVEFIPATFMQYPQLLEDGEVDAMVWDVDEAEGKLSSSVSSRPLSPNVLGQIKDADSRAALVARANDEVFHLVIKRCLDPQRLLKIQQDVIRGDHVPTY